MSNTINLKLEKQRAKTNQSTTSAPLTETSTNPKEPRPGLAMVGGQGSDSREANAQLSTPGQNSGNHKETTNLLATQEQQALPGECESSHSENSEASAAVAAEDPEANEMARKRQPKPRVPSSPLVTPPMGSNSSPQSPRGGENYLNSSMQGHSGDAAPSNVLASASAPTAHGFYTSVADFTAAPSQVAAAEETKVEAAAPAPSEAQDASSAHRSSSKAKPRGVPHVYHDFAQVSGPGPAYVRKKTGGVTQPFPDKLHEMLFHETSDDPSSAIVSWLPHGRAFIVRRPKEFTAQVMPKYFRQTKLTSFQRQLNLYGFRRITQGADAGAYYHEMFLQGRPSLSQRMVRQKVKGTGHKQPADVSSEPNFYSMPPVEPEFRGEPFGARYKATILPPSASGAPTMPYGLPADNRPTATLQTPPASQAEGTASAPGSPGIASVHGAAHLLHGFASSFVGGSAFLGASAHQTQGDGLPRHATDGRTQPANGAERETASKGTPASFLPRQDKA